MEKPIWISFDLGVRGDYEGLYTWLDSKGAVECGSSFAFFSYDASGDMIESLKKEIEENVELNKKARIYIIYRDPKTKKTKGKFIFGTRKAPPWTGYAGVENQAEEEMDEDSAEGVVGICESDINDGAVHHDRDIYGL
jgi:hypothetical protein